MSLISQLRRIINQYPVGDFAAIAERHRALVAVVQNTGRGWGSDIDLDSLPNEQVPWRRQRILPFVPVTWGLTLRTTLVLLPAIDLAVFILAQIHLHALDTVLVSLAAWLAPILSLSPLGARLAAAGVASLTTQHIFAYWAVDTIAFCVICAGLIGVALAEFVAFVRVIAAILIKPNGWADFLYRTVVTGLVLVGLGWALFATNLLDVYPAIFDGELGRKTLGIILLGALHAGFAFVLPLIFLFLCAALIGFIEVIARFFRRLSGPARGAP